MPLRAPKMNAFIFGFQRLVWWPKWTPASIISRMVIGASADGWDSVPSDESTAVSMVFLLRCCRRPRRRRSKPDRPTAEPPPLGTHDPLNGRVVLKRVRFLPHFQHPVTEKTRTYACRCNGTHVALMSLDAQ